MKQITYILLFLTCLGQSIYAQTSLAEKYDFMPWPKNVEESAAKFMINSELTINIANKNQGRVRAASINFLRRLSYRTGVFLNEGFPIDSETASIVINFKESPKLNIDNDESYILKVNSKNIEITSQTDIGAIRGLETLLQSLQHDSKSYYFPGLTISDSPRFSWRGLMIDVSRHFQPIAVIKRNLDAMAAVKMNVFHWHLTDDQGFRIESKAYPKLQELASDDLFYTQNQIKEIVNYADNLGIRIIPEIDVPGHASAILTAYPEIGSKANYDYSIERFSGVFHPTLDPTNEKTYTFLEHLFEEITPLFPDDYFHIGGDENEGVHWNENEAIQKFKSDHGLKTNHDLQTFFNIKLEKILNKLNKKLMGWDEIMTPNMPKTAVIHSWRGENEGLSNGSSLIDAAKQGYQTVLSNGYYIDRMLSVDHHYMVDPVGDAELTKEELGRILGGEVTMWSELVTPLNIDSRIWPRTAAIAERFWSKKEVNNLKNMKKRLEIVSFNLEELGLTHIKNRDLILRSMTHNQNISSLVELSNICEPLKMYSRNKDGIEYKTYSPFNLFADACVVDAKDAAIFNTAVYDFIQNKAEPSLIEILNYLDLWSDNYSKFSKLDMNPKINALEPLSRNLSQVSKTLSGALKQKNVSKHQLNESKTSMGILKQDIVDVELAISNSLEELLTYCKKHYLTK